MLPGIGPALTVAMLLPLTVNLDPDRRAHHVRRHLLRRDVRRLDDDDPAQHAGRDRRRSPPRSKATRWPSAAAPAPALATAAIGSFVAGTLATLLLTLLAPLVVEVALQVRARRVLRADGVRLRHRRGGARALARCAGCRACSSACCSGWSASTSQTGQTRFAFGVPELLDGIDVVVLAVGLFAVGEALYVAAYQSRLTETIETRVAARCG